MVPSGRAKVVSAPSTPSPASSSSSEAAVNGGHDVAQEPEQVLVFALSGLNVYRVRLLSPVR
jgi:hypothetical protein